MEKFDCIVVGAGLAGLAAAYILAQEGVEVLVLEKGDYPGAKNVTGGRLYVNPVRHMFPELWEKAPLERYITHEEISLMGREGSLTMSYVGNELAQPPYQSYSILIAKFDRWLAQQAEKKGAMLVAKSRVDGLIMENGRVTGVRAGGDELGADVVIAADGVMSLISEQAGLRKPGDPHHYAVGFKEVIEMDRTVIEDRFNLEGDEGAAHLFVGEEVTGGKFGGGFLYTNKDSLSLGIVVGIKGFLEETPGVQAPILLDQFKQRPEIARLIRGGQTVEYSAHAVPEGGFKALGRLYGNGILVAGDAAGLVMNIGITTRGMDYALASGFYAARAVLKARENSNFGPDSLKVYQDLLEDSFVLKDFRTFQHAPWVLATPRFLNYYPELAVNMMRDLYVIPDGPKEKLFTTMKKHMSLRDLMPMIGDLRRMTKI